jgi:hypothetical protein
VGYLCFSFSLSKVVVVLFAHRLTEVNLVLSFDGIPFRVLSGNDDKRFGGSRPDGTDGTSSFRTVKTFHWQKGRRDSVTRLLGNLRCILASVESTLACRCKAKVLLRGFGSGERFDLADRGRKCLAVFVARGKTTKEDRRRNTLTKGRAAQVQKNENLNLIGINYLWQANLKQLSERRVHVSETSTCNPSNAKQ